MAAQPVVLEGAFAAILNLAGVDQVLQFHSATEAERAEDYEAAIVSIPLDHGIRADVVIVLPEVNGDGGHPATQDHGYVRAGPVRHEVEIHDQRSIIDLIDLLDVHAPAAVSRSDRLREALA